MKEKILLSWSGGKDSAMALYEIGKTAEYEVAALLTTVSAAYDRISMHGVRRTLLEHQAEALGLPLEIVYLSPNPSNQEYEAKMEETLRTCQAKGIQAVAFGDIFLEDLRQYREENLAKIGMRGLFPLWQRDTRDLVRTFVSDGFQAVVICVDSKVLDRSVAGKLIDADFLERLPPPADPCGENGEFHSFVFAGPIFRLPVKFAKGEVVLRDGFWFCDLVPA